jgi:hypothetical protein
MRQSTTGLPDSPPPSYDSVAECLLLTLARFRFPYEACSLLELYALTTQTCEDIHTALQLDPEDWLPAFLHAGVPTDLALELCDIFKNDREIEDYHGSDDGLDGFIDLTLEDSLGD